MVSVPVIGNRSPGKEKCVEIDDQEYHDTQRLRDSQGVWKFESSRLPNKTERVMTLNQIIQSLTTPPIYYTPFEVWLQVASISPFSAGDGSAVALSNPPFKPQDQ